MRYSRKLEYPSPAQREDAECEETCNLNGTLMGRCMVQVFCEFTAIETPEASVSGVFIFGRLSRCETGWRRFQDALGSGL
jgi:hypothetical protein